MKVSIKFGPELVTLTFKRFSGAKVSIFLNSFEFGTLEPNRCWLLVTFVLECPRWKSSSMGKTNFIICIHPRIYWQLSIGGRTYVIPQQSEVFTPYQVFLWHQHHPHTSHNLALPMPLNLVLVQFQYGRLQVIHNYSWLQLENAIHLQPLYS